MAPLNPPAPKTRWPNGAKAAVSFTMDNLGEAQDVRTGTWPADQPHGTHPAVLVTLPRILDLLDGKKKNNNNSSSNNEEQDVVEPEEGKPIKATYFAESWSLPVYPRAVAALRDRGHEVAWHGFQHEVWHSLSEEDERANFERSFAAAEGHGVRYEGFRPPGGDINGARTLRLFKKYGIKYVSPLGEFGIVSSSSSSPSSAAAASNPGGGGGGGDINYDDDDDDDKGVVVLPFEWETVDAFWYMDKFAGIRKKHGVREEALGPEDFRAYLFKKLDEVVRDGGYISILFHPFLTTSEEKFKVLEDVLQRLRGDSDIWVAPCNEVARWVSEHAEQFDFKE